MSRTAATFVTSSHTGYPPLPRDLPALSSTEYLLVRHLQDKKIRVYSKDISSEVCKALKYAFEEWAKNKLQAQIPGTPWRKPRPVSNCVWRQKLSELAMQMQHIKFCFKS